MTYEQLLSGFFNNAVSSAVIITRGANREYSDYVKVITLASI